MTTQVDEIIAGIDELVSLPGVFVRVNQLVDDPHSTAQQIADAIAQDPGLTARLLRLANSAFYGFRAEIDTVGRAITIIGTRRLRDLVLATSTIQAFDGIPNDLVTLDDFWQHSIYCGLAARWLAERAAYKEGDSLFVAGLLHDIGQLIMYSQLSESSRQALLMNLEGDTALSLAQSEQAVMGFDHAQLGARLAQHWQLPELFVDCIAHHHDPLASRNYSFQAAAVHIANCLAILAELDSTQLEETDAPPIDPLAWGRVGLSLEIIPEAVGDIRARFDEMQAVLMGEVS